MGYRCPICLKDFGKDTKAWKEHNKKEHFGAGELYVKTTIRIAEDKEETE